MLNGLPHGSTHGANHGVFRTRSQTVEVGLSRKSLSLTPQQTGQLSKRLQDALTQFSGPLAGSCARIVHSAGRRLRPALTLACAASKDTGCPTTDAMTLAAAVELLHCATLVHDDVIDEASTRRGVATINAREGTPTAIVAGDALIAAAMQLSCGVSGEAASIMAETLALLCAGQAGEDALRFDFAATQDQVREVAAGKAGSLLRAACLLGAGAAGLGIDITHALGRYGTAFGVCLQAVDDILDLASTMPQLGKPIGADIAAGVMTGPIVECLRVRPELAGLLGSPTGSVEHARALRLLRTSDVIELAVDSARSTARIAGAELQAAAGTNARVVEIAAWAPHFVEAQLRDKLDPELAYLSLQSDRLSQRTA